MNSNGIVGYLRVSTANQVENGDGLEIQKRKIIEYCEEHKLEVEVFYEDRGISGAVKDRPGLLGLLKDCESGKVKRVIVYKQDRLSRELTVALWIETQFKKYDVELHSVCDPDYDMEDPLQKAFKRIADIFAELEKDVIASRLKEGRINNAKNGERGSGPIPFGYRKLDDVLIPDENESNWVDKIFRWRSKGFSYTRIIKSLNRHGVVSKRGKQFSIDSLKYLLGNSLYCGESSFGDISVKGVHQPLISRRLFLRVQK